VNQRRPVHLLKMGLSYMASSGALLLSSAAQLLTFALLARYLGAHEFAIFVSITAVTNLGVQISGLGSQESLIRRVAQDEASFPVMLGHSCILSLVTGAVLFIIGLAIIPYFFPTSDNLLQTLVTVASILFTNLILLKIISLSTQSFIGHSRFADANQIEVIFAVVRMLTAAVACLLFQISTVDQWAMWNLFGHLVVALIALRAVNRLGRPVFRLVHDEIKIGFLFSTQFLFKALRGNADVLVLGAVASAEVLSSYSIARRMLDSSYLSVEALNRLIYPGSAAAALSGMGHVIARAVNVLKASLLIAFGSALTIFIFAPFLPLLFGESYTSLPSFTRIMCWLIIPLAIASSALEALGAAGHQSIRAKIWNSGNVLGAILVAGATYQFGINGTFGAYYFVEIAIAAAVWWALLNLRKTAEFQR
jgi:O-antigen/teichoic acid export membrane protein